MNTAKANIYIVDMTNVNEWKIITFYTTFGAYLNGERLPCKEKERERFELSTILLNLRMFKLENILSYIDDLKISQIHELLNKQ